MFLQSKHRVDKNGEGIENYDVNALIRWLGFTSIWTVISIVGPQASAQITQLSNLSESPSLSAAADSDFLLAQSFVTGPATVLYSIQLLAGSSWPSLPSGNLIVSLYSDASGLPGARLATLSGPNPYGAIPAVVTYSPSNLVSLAAFTKYWILVKSTDPAASTYYIWFASNTTNYTATNGWAAGEVASYDTVEWTTTNTAMFSFAVNTIDLVPTLALQQINSTVWLSFATISNFPYAIQYNTNLTTTNWISFTNFIGDGTVKAIPISTTNPPQFFRTRSL